MGNTEYNVKAMAESILMWQKQFNKAMTELEALDGEKRFRVMEESIEEILKSYDMVWYQKDDDNDE